MGTLITETEFETEYRPIVNAHGDAVVDYSHAVSAPINYVWTIVDGDNGRDLYAAPGFHVVNRIGYVITERPWTDDIETAEWSIAERAPTPHWHAHSSLGNGYLCECDGHAAYATRRDLYAALRELRDSWREYIADTPDDAGADYRITGSVRAGWFDIDDRASLGWSRAVRSWECSDDCTMDGN